MQVPLCEAAISSMAIVYSNHGYSCTSRSVCTWYRNLRSVTGMLARVNNYYFRIIYVERGVNDNVYDNIQCDVFRHFSIG